MATYVCDARLTTTRIRERERATMLRLSVLGADLRAIRALRAERIAAVSRALRLCILHPSNRGELHRGHRVSAADLIRLLARKDTDLPLQKPPQHCRRKRPMGLP